MLLRGVWTGILVGTRRVITQDRRQQAPSQILTNNPNVSFLNKEMEFADEPKYDNLRQNVLSFEEV